MVLPLEIKGAAAGILTSALILGATFTAGGIYRNYSSRKIEPGNQSPDTANLAIKGTKALSAKLRTLSRPGRR